MSNRIVIVGGGPAGMFAALTIASSDLGLETLLIEQGKDVSKRRCPQEATGYCTNCRPCDIMAGMGGAGTFSDGTLNLRPNIGGNLEEFTSREDAWNLVEEVDKIFLKFGSPKDIYEPTGPELRKLKLRAASSGINFMETRQRHIGSDRAPRVIDRFVKELRQMGVKIRANTKVKDILVEKGRCVGVKLEDDSIIRAGKVILAPGRVGAPWVDELVSRHGVDSRHEPLDLGVRVEVPAIIMEEVTNINRDPKFQMRTKTYDDFVRTFCTNPYGFVVKESYDGFIGVNGHCFANTRSENTNFAFLVRMELTEPVEDTIKYGKSVAMLATTIGGGKPTIQRMGDLKSGRRSTHSRIKRNQVVNTLKDITPGDISMALPHRVVMDIIEGLEMLNKAIPGVFSDSTLLYAPEIKFYSIRIEVNDDMESSVKDLHVAGDGAGLSRDIVNAGATGILAARGVLRSFES